MLFRFACRHALGVVCLGVGGLTATVSAQGVEEPVLVAALMEAAAADGDQLAASPALLAEAAPGALPNLGADLPPVPPGLPSVAPESPPVTSLAVTAAAATPLLNATRPRPAALLPLYASYITLQALDVHSTARGLERGAVEGNPLLKGAARNPAMLLGVKAAVTGLVIFGTEKLRKNHRTLSVVLMAALNGVTVYVVHQNYRTASGL